MAVDSFANWAHQPSPLSLCVPRGRKELKARIRRYPQGRVEMRKTDSYVASSQEPGKSKHVAHQDCPHTDRAWVGQGDLIWQEHRHRAGRNVSCRKFLEAQSGDL